MKTLYTTYNNFAKRLVMSLMVLMTVGVGSVWGETWTWTANAGGDLGSKNGTVTLNGKSWNVSRSSWTQAGTMNNGCIQVGSKNNPTSLTLETDDFAEYTITKIDVVCSSHKGNHNITMLVGSNTFYSTSSTPIGDGSKAAKVSGTGSAAGTITISFTQKSTEWRAMYIKSITVTYEVAATCTTAPTVSAGSHSNVTTNSATVTCSSGLTSLGSAGCSIKSYGFVYGTSSNPTISNTKVQVGTSYTTTSTSFNKSITGLSANTTYYVRPYATNGYGTAYGTQTSFKTKEIKYTVTYNANGATGTVPTDANEYASGATVTVMSHGDLAKIGYSFTGWKRNDNSAIVQENATFTMPASNLTLTAQWTAKALTNYRTTCTTETIVTLDPNGGTISNTDGWTDNRNGTYSKIHEGTEIALPTATKTNYIFGGWYNGETKYESIPSDLVESITLTAKWLEKQDAGIYWDSESVTVTIDADGNTLPVFNNPNEIDGITFSSSNSSVVAVDANGVITLGSTGTTATVTITATFDGNETYAAKTVTCSITVHPSNCRWEEVTIDDIEYGDEVVIAMEKNGYTYALADNNTAAKEAPLATEISINANKTINTDITTISTPLIWNIDYDKEDTKNLVIYSTKNVGKWLYSNDANDGVRIGDNTNKEFKIVKGIGDDTENTFLYHVAQDRYLGVYYIENDWRGYTLTDKGAFPNNIKGQTLKFYKKECIAFDEYWIIYNLENVTCNSEMPNYIGTDGEIELYFSANSGYKLPEQVSITMGGLPLSEDAFAWEAEEGLLYIIPDGGITGNLVITIEGCELLALPTNLKATNITSSSARLTWDEIEHAEQYQVHVTDDDDSTEDIITTTSSTYFEITGLKSASPYLWGVTPIASGYCGITQEAEYFETLDVYTVTFNTDGGTAVESQPVDHGSKATKPANPTKTGYTFAGWYTEPAYTNLFDFNTVITANTTLYAKWNANQYTITFLKQWGNGGTDNATVTFNSNNFSVVTIELPTRDGYEFGGYYTETGGAGLQIVDAEGKWLKNKTGYLDASGNWIKAESVNLYAKWTKIHTITWVVNNNTETPHHTSTALDGSTIDALPMPPADDLFEDCEVNAFVGWSTDNIGLEPDATAPTDLFKTIAEAQSKIGAINGDKKFYAVYASASNGADSYKPATTVEDLFDGQTVIIAKDNGALERDNNTIDKVNISPDGNGNLSNVTDNIKWTLEASDTHWKLKNNGGYLGVTSTASQTAVSVTEINNVWQIAKSSATGNYFYICQPNTTTGLQYFNSRWQIYSNNGIASSTNFTLKIYVPNVSNYITRCTALPDPVWGEATIDKTEIAVNCGETSSTNGAARISFPKETNYNLYKDITVEVTSGNFIIASSRDGEYTTSVTLTPTQSGTNVGTLDGKYVYVRAVAPPMSSDQLTGTITISGKQIATQVINVTATVTCNEYTLTFNDCGDTKTITDFAGTSVEEMEPWAEICSEPVQYVFDGWATAPVTNGTEEYGKVDFSRFTMPNNNTTILYAVYRYAEEGGEPVNGYVKVTESLSDWSGDYVIVNETAKKAIKSEYKTNTNSNKTLKAEDVTLNNNMVVSPSEDVIWQIRKKGNYYTMYNETAKKYAYITQGKSEAAGLDDNPQDLMISFNNSNATIYSETYSRCFSYYDTNIEWRTYSTQTYSTGALYRLAEKSIRYTSSLVCGTIEAKDALVTSTKDQKVKVKVPITLESSTGVTTITATSDNAAFDVTGLTDVEEGDHTIVVEYTPAEYNITETANITLSATNGATSTFTVSGRSLPENFVIATKVGAIWYALPANMNGATNPEGVVIDVDETTMTATAPNTTVYTLFPVATINGNSDRYKEYGERLRFAAVNNGNKGLWANNADNGTKINNDAAITAANSTAGAAYEWKITTTIVDGNWQYTLQTYQSNNQKYLRYWTAASGGAKWGTYASGNDKLYFLPVTETKPFDYKVVEWYPTKVLIQTEAAITNPIVKIGGILVDNVTCTNKGGKLYEISGLPLVNNPTKVLTLSYTADEVTYTNSKVVPIILSRETKSISGEPFVDLTKEVYNYADLVVRDGAILTMDGTQEANTLWDVTIYPKSKIYVPQSQKLTVHSLTLFGGIDEIYNGSTYTLNKYGVPELSLKGSLKKSISTIDYLMRVNLDQMYSLSVPYDVQLADIKYWDGSNIELGSALYVSAYDGEARANQSKKTWIYETDFNPATLKAGVGYTISAELQAGVGSEYSILRMPMNSNIANDATEGEKKVSVTAHGIDANITDNHKGWNLVGNPYMTTIQGADDADLVLGYLKETGTGPWEWVEKTYRYVTIPSDDGTYYWQQKFTDAVLPPFKNFFVQVGTTGELVFDLGTRQSMPARSTQAAIEKEMEFEILMSNDARQDNTGLLISEEYSPAYEINADLEKMIGSMSVYTIYGGYKLAYNALSPINASEWIPMGYIAPAAGEYTFRLDDVENIAEQVEHVYIIDYNANNIVDLMDEEYKFTTDKEQNDNRFAINVVLSQDKDNTTTGLDMIQGNNAAPIKFIYHDKMYIQSGGVIYDGTGKQVTNINK